MSLIKRIQDGWLGEYAAEGIFFGFKIAEAMLDPSIRLYIYQTVCRSEFPEDASCYDLQSSPERENHVQNIAASYTVIYKVLLNAPVVALALFCGAWSDHIGRKIPVVLTCLGSILAVILFMVSIIETVPTMPFILAGSLLRGMFGKSAVVTMALHSYITDITSSEQRTRRFGTLLGMNFFGYFVGSLLSGLILEWGSFNIVFCIVVVVYALCVFISLLCMRESLPNPLASLGDNMPSLRNPFTMTHIKESFSVVIRPRKNHERAYLWFFFFCITAHQTCKSGEVDVTLLFTKRYPMLWSKSLYGYFLATDYAALGFSVLLLLPILVKYAKMNDTALIVLGLMFKVIRLMIMSFSTNTFIIFASVVISSPAALVASGVKSLISKTVDEEEIGKAFSLLSCMETLSNLAGSIAFNSVYAATSSTIAPGFTFLVDGIFQFVLLVIVIAMTQDMRSCTKYRILDVSAIDAKMYGSTKNVIGSSGISTALHKSKDKDVCPMSIDNITYDESSDDSVREEYSIFEDEPKSMPCIQEESRSKTNKNGKDSREETDKLANCERNESIN